MRLTVGFEWRTTACSRTPSVCSLSGSTPPHLALAFEESTASSTDLLVEGASFFPRMLDDIAAATSSVHVNQFGFKPGTVGDAFAEALAAKAAHGRARPVDRRPDAAPIPTDSSRRLYRGAGGRRRHSVCRAGDQAARAVGPDRRTAGRCAGT